MKWLACVALASVALATFAAVASDLPDEWRQRNRASLKASGGEDYEMAVVQQFMDRSVEACMKARVAATPKGAALQQPPRVSVYLEIDAKGAVSDVAVNQDDGFAQCLQKKGRALVFAPPPQDPFVAMVSVSVRLSRGGQR